MTFNKVLLALALCFVLASCTDRPRPQTIATTEGINTIGLERSVERFSGPDKYGVVCYQDYYSNRNLSCVKVTDNVEPARN